MSIKLKNQKNKTLLMAILSVSFLLFVTSLYFECMKFNFEVAPFFLLIYLIYYPISFYLIKKYIHQLRGTRIREFKLLVNKPFIITYPILITALFVCFVIQAILIKWYYIFGALFCAGTVTSCYLFVKWVYSENLILKKGKTKRLIEKVLGNSYFMNGVDILDSQNRVKIDGKNVVLINPFTNEKVYTDAEIYKIKGRQFNFFVAIKEFENDVKLVYLTCFRDYYKLFIYNFNDYRVHDIMQNKRLESSAFMDLVKSQSKADEFYSWDYKRCVKISENANKFTVVGTLVVEAGQDLFIDTSHIEDHAAKRIRLLNYYTDGDVIISRHDCYSAIFDTLDEAEKASKVFMACESVNLKYDANHQKVK